jgi:hypothetical protein
MRTRLVLYPDFRSINKRKVVYSLNIGGLLCQFPKEEHSGHGVEIGVRMTKYMRPDCPFVPNAMSPSYPIGLAHIVGNIKDKKS